MNVVDLSLLDELRAYMEEDIYGLIGTFEAETRKQLVHVAEAIDNRDAKSLRLIAHSLKGGAATLGAASLAEQFRSLELRARDLSFSGIEQDLANTQRSFDEAVTALNKWLAQL